jgi:hypothetical protein
VYFDQRGCGAVEAAFKRYLLNGDASIASTVASSPKLGATHRLEIYGNAYRARLTEALASDYPILRSALGEERFRELCSRYIAVHPSRSFTLRDYGACLPRFIAAGACFVWRRELTTFFRAIDATERAAWLVLCRGETFAAMCDELSRTLEPGTVPLRAATYLHSWLQDGLISRVRLV